jgi:hypothetical protein
VVKELLDKDIMAVHPTEVDILHLAQAVVVEQVA